MTIEMKGRNLNNKDQKIKRKYPIKILASYFLDSNKQILQFIWKSKDRIANTRLMKKNKIRGQTLPNLKIYFRSQSNQGSVLLTKEQTNRSMKQLGRPEIDSYKHSQVSFDKRAKMVQWRKSSLFNKLGWNQLYIQTL